MAEKSSFFNSVSGDRKYSAEDWAAYFAAFVGNGVYANPSNGLQVMASTGMGITIKAGKGFINGYFYQLTMDMSKTLSVADGLYSRIDRVVLRWSLLERSMYVHVLEGTPSSTPTAPVLSRDVEVYEIALADILVGRGVTEIIQSNITDRRANSDLCGIVTAVIDQYDFSTFTEQFESFFADYRQRIAAEYNYWSQLGQSRYDSLDAAMDAFEDVAQANFNEWFENLQYILDGDVAGHLQNEIDAMQDVVDKAVDDLTKQMENTVNQIKNLKFENVEVQASAFIADETYPDFPYRAAVSLAEVGSDMVPGVTFSVVDALSGNFAPLAECYDGGVYIYATQIPEATITIPTIICWR